MNEPRCQIKQNPRDGFPGEKKHQALSQDKNFDATLLTPTTQRSLMVHLTPMR
jgi:hypothetical protein